MDNRGGRNVAHDQSSYSYDRREGGRGGSSYNKGRGYGRGGQGVCYAHQRGECTRGSTCRYSHDGVNQSAGRGGYQGNREGRGGGGLQTERTRPSGGRGWSGKKPDNMMERPGHVAIPEAVNIVNVIVVSIGNFTDPEAYENLASSVQEVAELLVEQGDLETYADAISDIFVKCFSQLTMQTPVIATLLSLISKRNRVFPTLVLEKLSAQLSTALHSGDVVVARNHLRAYCCLASAGCVSIDGDGDGRGIVHLLGALCDAAEEQLTPSHKLSVAVETGIYLLASCVPYAFTALQASPSPLCAELASRIAALCRRVTDADANGDRRISPYDTNGFQPVFHVSIDGTAGLACAGDSTTGHTQQESSPPGAVCWDSLWETCKVADNILTSINATAGASLSAENVPKCLLLLWYHPELQDPLQKDVAQLPSSADSEEAPPVSVLPPRIVLESVDTSAIHATIVSDAFKVLAGPVVDYYAAPTHTTGNSKTERAKTGNNSSGGYGSWMAVRFNVFDEDISTDCIKALTSLTFLELVTARDYFRSVLRFLEPFIRDDGTRVGSIQLLCQHLLSVFQFFPADVHLEYILLETLLMMIVQVPSLNHSLVERVLLELCVQSPQAPAVLAVVTCAFYEFIPAMNVVSWRELSTFLSGHLCNTHLAWPYWQYWGEEYAATIATDDFAANGSSQKVFIDLLVGQCTRMSLPERMAEVLTQDLVSIIPPDESIFAPKCINYTMDKGICSGTGSLQTVADELMRKIFARETAPEVLQWLEGSHDSVDETFEVQGWRIRLFFEALLCRGTAAGGTIWGMIGLLDRYHAALVDLSISFDGAYETIAHTLFTSLHSQCALLQILLDTLMRRGALAPQGVVAYMIQRTVPVPGNLHISNVHTNQWVWRIIEVCMARSLDMVKAAMSTQNTAAFTQREAALTAGGMDDGDGDEDAAGEDEEEDKPVDSDNRRSRNFANGSGPVKVVISEDILETVEVATDGAKHFYSSLATSLLQSIQTRHSSLVASGSETAGSVESGAVTSLDPSLVVNISLLHNILRNFHMSEVGLLNSQAEGTTFPAITDRQTVAKNILAFGGIGGDGDAKGAKALSVLTGPAQKVWAIYCELE